MESGWLSRTRSPRRFGDNDAFSGNFFKSRAWRKFSENGLKSPNLLAGDERSPPAPDPPAEGDDLLAVIREQVEKERRDKQAESQSKTSEPIPQKIAGQPKNDNSKETSAKAAEIFNTNRTYVNQAVKMKSAEGDDTRERFKRSRAAGNRQGGALPDWTRLPPFRYRADCGGS